MKYFAAAFLALTVYSQALAQGYPAPEDVYAQQQAYYPRPQAAPQAHYPQPSAPPPAAYYPQPTQPAPAGYAEPQAYAQRGGYAQQGAYGGPQGGYYGNPQAAQPSQAPSQGGYYHNTDTFWAERGVRRLEHASFYIGEFDTHDENNDQFQFGFEYRGEDIYYGVRPSVGITYTLDDSIYFYAGAHWDLFLTDSIVFSPNFMIGAYSQGDGKDLGSALEFRSGIEGAYQFDNGMRLGIAYNHISNASIGDINPGAETINLVYSYPLDVF